MKNNLEIYFSSISYYFTNKKNKLVYLILLIGVLVPAFSGSSTTNFWFRLYNIFGSSFLWFSFFLAVGISSLNSFELYFKNYNIYNRYSDFKSLVKKYILDISMFTTILYVSLLIFSIAGALMFSYNNFTTYLYQEYNINIVIYIIFKIITNYIFSILVNIIVYSLPFVLKKFEIICLVLLNCFTFQLPSLRSSINHFYEMPFLYHEYFSSLKCSSFLLELICNLFMILTLFLFNNLVYYIVTRKKRDVC